MKTVRQGQSLPEVVLLQRLLNLRLSPMPKLKEDGRLGPKTATEVRNFQRTDKKLVKDGTVGPNTWRALGITIEINHPVRLFAQPNNMSCWSAAATMLFGNISVGPGTAALAAGGLIPTVANLQRFATSTRTNPRQLQTWTVQGFAMLMRTHGPLWIGGYVPLAAAVGPTAGHVVVAGAMWSDGAPNGAGTAVLIYDPWPVGMGSIYPVIYGDRVQQYPMGSLYILHR